MTESPGPGPDVQQAGRPPGRRIMRSMLRAAGSTSLLAYQVRAITRSPFPLLRGVEALATSIPLFLLLFAATYVVMATISASSFSQPLSRTDAIYFTVTVFATVGFGDITAKTEV